MILSILENRQQCKVGRSDAGKYMVVYMGYRYSVWFLPGLRSVFPWSPLSLYDVAVCMAISARRPAVDGFLAFPESPQAGKVHSESIQFGRGGGHSQQFA